MRWKKNLLTVAILIAVYLLIRTYQTHSYQRGTAPLFKLENIQGSVVDLEAYRGRPVLLYFWAPWCPICKLERGSIESIAADYPVITVAAWSDDIEEVAHYFSTPQMAAVTLHDPAGELAREYGVSGVPSFFVIDSSGRIRFIERGYTSSLGLRARLILADLF